MYYENTNDVHARLALIKAHNTFYSLCRGVTNYESDNMDLINTEAEKLKNLFSKNEKDYYYKMLDFLNKKLLKRKITCEEATLIILFAIDPDFEMYQIYEEYCNVEKIKENIIKEFNFYDDKYLKLEKNYLKYNNLEDEYSFAPKKKLK